MSDAVSELLSILDLEPIEVDIFRGISPQVGWQRVFGGLVVAQALVAAQRTVPDRPPHSLHAYFILPGDPAAPIVYEVERIRDGRSFATRRCVAIQHGHPIFTLSASFHTPEDGLEHQIDMPDVVGPENLPALTDVVAGLGAAIPEPVRRYFERERPIELRPVDMARYMPAKPGAKLLPKQNVWLKASAPLPDDPAVHRAVLAYLSDMTLLDTSLAAHGRSVFDPGIQGASLDHAIWFHRPFRADEWLLFAQDSPNTSGALGLTRGQIYSRSGALVASVAQEGLIRPRMAKPPAA
jgi:acyl-CoA thioesterase-2